MVIDDDEISLSIISLLLKSDGYEILQASDGATALDLLGTLQSVAMPWVILADLRMPGLSGRDLAVELRRVAPRAKLLAMSATPGTAADGYDAFLKKPMDAATLRAALEGHGCTPVAEPVANDKQPVLDERVYENMTRMMPATAVREVYEACVNDVRARGLEMRAAGTANDLALVRRTAHTFKGSAGMIGATKLASAAAELELGVYQPEDVPQLIDNLLSCCDQLHRILLTRLQL
jgi:CheY-like chemotaxis protein